MVTVSAERQGERAALRVTDSGVGIAPEHLPHLFERFYRVDQARARAAGGAGLGLTISRWIAEAHSGTIHVESEPGRGTTFTVELPLTAERERNGAAMKHPSSLLHGAFMSAHDDEPAGRGRTSRSTRALEETPEWPKQP